MSGPLDLTPSLEKISRAERKFNHVKAMLDEWTVNGVDCAIRRELHGQRCHVIGRVESLPPEDVSWEIVEAVGHLRSALDKMVVALVKANGRGVSGVGFPFGGSGPDGKPEPFPSARHDGLKKKLTPDQWRLVLAQEPHPGGNNLLWAVNEIANEDKHRESLVKVFPSFVLHSSQFTSRGLFFTGGATRSAFAIGGDSDFFCPDQERETLLASYAFGPGSVHPEMEHSVTFHVVFGKIVPVTGKEVLGTLYQQLRLVKGIVEIFRNTF